MYITSYNTSHLDVRWALIRNIQGIVICIAYCQYVVSLKVAFKAETSKHFIHQPMHNWIVLKTILKFALKLTLKQLRRVLVQSPSSGSVLLELAKVTVVKIAN
jgi:hypothetical protein